MRSGSERLTATATWAEGRCQVEFGLEQLQTVAPSRPRTRGGGRSACRLTANRAADGVDCGRRAISTPHNSHGNITLPPPRQAGIAARHRAQLRGAAGARVRRQLRLHHLPCDRPRGRGSPLAGRGGGGRPPGDGRRPDPAFPAGLPGGGHRRRGGGDAAVRASTFTIALSRGSWGICARSLSCAAI